MFAPQAQLAQAAAYAARHMPPQAAGIFACDVPLLRVENNVGGTHIGIPLPRALQRRIFSLRNKNFNGASACLGSDDAHTHGTALLFEPGSIVIVGVPTAPALRLLVHKLCDVLRAVGQRPHILFVSIDNRVATGRLGFPVALERMHRCMEGFVTTYQPDLFPGMICMRQAYREQIVMTLFESGNVTALGIRSIHSGGLVFRQVATMAAANRAPPAAAAAAAGQGGLRLRRKSSERMARLLSEETACEADYERESNKRGMNRRVVEEMLKCGRLYADLGEERCIAQTQQHMDRFVAEQIARLASKRRR